MNTYLLIFLPTATISAFTSANCSISTAHVSYLSLLLRGSGSGGTEVSVEDRNPLLSLVLFNALNLFIYSISFLKVFKVQPWASPSSWVLALASQEDRESNLRIHTCGL